MGSCQSGNENMIKVSKSNQNTRPAYNTIEKPVDIVRQLESKFKDMPEWPGERYKGVGVKRMKGYVCNLPIDELNQKREEFWSQKCKEKAVWMQIKRACIMDDGKISFTT